MGLRAFAAPRPFVVAAADGTRERVAVEAELRSRGWRPALSPAETGMLVVCGNPGAALSDAIQTVWRDMPEPRVRAPADLDGADLDGADLDGAKLQGGAGGSRPALDLDGVGMADRADDRDGLRLDVLHVPLGPVLADWPAGLRVDLTVQGDVVQAAEVTAVDTADGPSWDEGQRAASGLDSVSRLLRVAGWDAAGERAAVLRDEALGGVPDDVLARRFAQFARRVGRSRLLRWMAPGDVRDRLGGWLREIGSALDGEATRPRTPWDASLAVLPSLLEGAELAEARLVVASLDPDLGTAPDG
ncbi:pentapeptide repeat-containing protein [Actinomadura sp. 7K507]|uniref:pentapeptide repeat-containing protein n=1 Tax=Actinomadura sp. 7K507 TaxID=2530365 RepID=UPI001043FE97|nr:pentapeptide repeat-containing protein [Actinomadura sp. 7K507]TDC83619.1 hypothetical protein E1285_28520 [Actinomadura sp. 7K507]